MKICAKCKVPKSHTSFSRHVRGKVREFIGCNDCAKRQSVAAKAAEKKRRAKKRKFEEKELQGICLISRQLLNRPIVNI